MKALTYLVTLLEPVLVAGLEGDPNASVALPYLPGSVLRGALITGYQQQHGLAELDAADPHIRQLFFDGSVRYLNGYLTDASTAASTATRSLPTLLSWYVDKGKDKEIYDLAVELPDQREELVPFAPGFWLTDANEYERPQARLLQPAFYTAQHTACTPRYGRPMPKRKLGLHELAGAVYTYRALAPGQTFAAVVLCNDEQAREEIEPLLSGAGFLGGARSAGYGRVRFEQAKSQPAGWREVNAELKAGDAVLTVTLLSDALLRDENGQPAIDPELVTCALSDALGTQLQLKQAFLRGQPTGGFNRKWGLPLPQQLAIQKGSVFVYACPQCSLATLRRVEEAGIGERRVDGFGRLVFNWLEEPLWYKTSYNPNQPSACILTDSVSRQLAQSVGERRLLGILDGQLAASAGRLHLDAKALNKAQLERLHVIIRNEIMAENPSLERIKAYLADLDARQAVRKQWRQARVGGKPLLDWLQKVLACQDEEAFRTELGLTALPTFGLGGVTPTLPERRRKEYLLRYVDEVLKRAAKDKGGNSHHGTDAVGS